MSKCEHNVFGTACPICNNIWQPETKEAMSDHQTILQEAQSLVYGNRQQDYGSVTANFQKIADLWAVMLGVEVTPEQVALCMVQVKVARQMHKPKRDNLVDGAGYFATIEKMDIEKQFETDLTKKP